jgi:hypothetical protein
MAAFGWRLQKPSRAIERPERRSAYLNVLKILGQTLALFKLA